MKIKAEIKTVFNHNNDRLKAIAALVFDDCFIIKSVRLVKGRDGLFVSMPSIENSYGGYTDVCHPLDPDLKAVIDITVIEAYYEFMSQGNMHGGAERR